MCLQHQHTVTFMKQLISLQLWHLSVFIYLPVCLWLFVVHKFLWNISSLIAIPYHITSIYCMKELNLSGKRHICTAGTVLTYLYSRNSPDISVQLEQSWHICTVGTVLTYLYSWNSLDISVQLKQFWHTCTAGTVLTYLYSWNSLDISV